MAAHAVPPRAFVFDAYGTLFDVRALAANAEEAAPGHGADLAGRWRAKQLEYSWLATIMERRTDFAAVTAEALDYALAALGLAIAPPVHKRLLDAWLALPAWPDARSTLERLAPAPRWILSNGSRAMLAPLVASSPLAGSIDGVISVDDAGAFKPAPRVYALASAALRRPPAEIAFVSANGWDAAGAKAQGFTTFWVNRAGLPVERHAPAPDYVVGSLADVAAAVAG